MARKKKIIRGYRDKIAEMIGLSATQVSNILHGRTNNPDKLLEIKLAIKTIKRQAKEEAIKKVNEKFQ